MSLFQFLRDIWHAVHPTPSCSCNPVHTEIGGYDPGCPVHDQEPADV